MSLVAPQISAGPPGDTLTIDQIRPCKVEARLNNVLQLYFPAHIILQEKHKGPLTERVRGLRLPSVGNQVCLNQTAFFSYTNSSCDLSACCLDETYRVEARLKPPSCAQPTGAIRCVGATDAAIRPRPEGRPPRRSTRGELLDLRAPFSLKDLLPVVRFLLCLYWPFSQMSQNASNMAALKDGAQRKGSCVAVTHTPLDGLLWHCTVVSSRRENGSLQHHLFLFYKRNKYLST